jgi:hypothetical protein
MENAFGKNQNIIIGVDRETKELEGLLRQVKFGEGGIECFGSADLAIARIRKDAGSVIALVSRSKIDYNGNEWGGPDLIDDARKEGVPICVILTTTPNDQELNKRSAIKYPSGANAFVIADITPNAQKSPSWNIARAFEKQIQQASL